MEAQERSPTNAGTANTPQIQKKLFVLRYNPPFSFVLYYGTGPELSTSDHLLPRLGPALHFNPRTKTDPNPGSSKRPLMQPCHWSTSSQTE